MTGGHGHVVPRPDGAKARCGGPPLCSVCAIELAQAQAGTAGSPTIPSRWLAEADAIAPPSDSLYSTEGEVRRHERARTLRECAERLLKPPEWPEGSFTRGRAAKVNDHDFMHPGQYHAPGACESCDKRRNEVTLPGRVAALASQWEQDSDAMREQSVRDGLHPALASGHREANLLMQRAADLRSVLAGDPR